MTLDCRPCGFEDLEGWQDDDYLTAFNAFVRSADFHLNQSKYNERLVNIDQARLDLTYSKSLRIASKENLTNEVARSFFEEEFTPHIICEGKDGFVTAYYEPEVEVSRERDEKYKFPLHRQPPDLVSIKHLKKQPNGTPDGFEYARKTDSGFEVFANRQAIDQGYLDGHGLEIAYAKSKADVYFTHIQGSAKLVMPDEKSLRISFAAKSGHPYSSIGKILVSKGHIPEDKISMDAICQWMEAFPKQVDKILWQNQSYIFFKENNRLDAQLGPIGAANVQLTPGRSIALDRKVYQFGLPIFISTDTDIINVGQPFRQLMVGQDTGSAIVGPARGDIFIGSGVRAGSIAGKVQETAKFYILLPKI